MDSDTSLKSRRAVIGAALGGAAAVTLGALAKPAAVAALDPDDVQLGVPNAATATTSVENSDATEGAVSLAGTHAGLGVGVRGASAEGVGVYGASGDDSGQAVFPAAGVMGVADPIMGMVGTFGVGDGSVGVVGVGFDGVYGFGESWGVLGEGADLGVYGYGDPGGVGVLGVVGAEPTSAPANVAVWAYAASTSMTALQVNGKVKLSRSGRVSVGSTSTSKSVTMAGVTTSSNIIATLQTSVSGVDVARSHRPRARSRIHLSRRPARPSGSATSS